MLWIKSSKFWMWKVVECDGKSRLRLDFSLAIIKWYEMRYYFPSYQKAKCIWVQFIKLGVFYKVDAT